MAIDELVAEGYKTNLRPRYITVEVENPIDSTKDKTEIRFMPANLVGIFLSNAFY